MDLIVIVLFIIFILILNNNYENFENCEYRIGKKGKMCKEKWGTPQCNPWIPNEKMKLFENIQSASPMRSYYKNHFDYFLNYEKEEDEEEGPKGVNSTFFS